MKLRIHTILLYFSFICLMNVSVGQALSGYLPKQGSYLAGPNVDLYWNLHTDAIDYAVELCPQSDFATGVISSPTVGVTNWTSPSLSSGDWYWRVIGNLPGGTQYSGIQHFTIFTPADNNNTSLWLDAGSGVVTDMGGLVQEWQDGSSNGYSLVQGNGSERPAVNPTALNGLPALSFSGAQFLEGGDILDIGSGNRAMLVVGKMNGGNQTFLSKSLYGSASSRYALTNISGQLYYIYVDIANRNISSSSVTTSYALYSGITDRLTSTNQLKVNQSVLGSSTITTSYNMNSAFRFLIGAYNDASDAGELLHLNGEISEMVFVDFADALEINDVNYYLRDKYSPPLDLGEDIYVQDRFCDTNLTATAGYTNILWSTTETTNTIAVNEGTYWVEGTDLFGFVHRDTIEVHYPEIPGPPTTGICAGSNVVWNADLGAGFTYVWSTAETTPNISVTSAGNYSVEVFDGYGCSRLSNTETFTIDNYATTAWLGNDTNLCIGNELYLQVGAAETVSYLWPDASSGPYYGVDTTGMYWVESTNVNGCVAQDTININILGNAPTAFFTTPDDCLGQTTSFSDASTPQGGDPLVSWDWDFGDSNTDNVSNTSNQYASNGMYVVTLDIVAQSGCGDRYIDTIFIYTPPTANYSFAGHCSADSVFFTDASTTGEGMLNAWSWDFGQPASGQNTSTIQDPGYLYNEVNSFSVELIVTDANGCQDTVTQTVNIDPSPESFFTVVDGCLDASLDVTNNATIGVPGFIVSYNWDFGDGTTSTSSNPNKTYATHGVYDVQLVTTSNLGCKDTVVQSVTIHALPVPNFTFSNECVGLPAIFTDISTVADGVIDSSRWIYDVFDTLYGNPNYYTFDTEIDHFVKLSTYSQWGCQKDTIKLVPVGPALNAAFTTLNGGSIVVGSPVQFFNSTTGGDSYLWDLGDLSTSTDSDPTHSYAEYLLDSTITVSMVASNTFGCSDTVFHSYLISRAMLDLEVQKLFLLEQNGYFDVAVQLHNKGTARIEGADLELRLQNGTVMMEYYPDTLYASQTQIYVLNSHPSAVFSDQDNQEGYACLKATPYTNPMLDEEDWTNNERCQNVEGTNPILIGPNPNPTDGIVELGVLLTQEGTVDLALYDERGRLVQMIYDGETLSKGYHLNALDLSVYGNGVYILRLVSDGFVSTKKLVKK